MLDLLSIHYFGVPQVLSDKLNSAKKVLTRAGKALKDQVINETQPVQKPDKWTLKHVISFVFNGILNFMGYLMLKPTIIDKHYWEGDSYLTH